MRMRGERGEGRGGVVRNLPEAIPANSTLALQVGNRLRRLLIFDSKKGRNGNEILRGGAGYDLVYDHSKIVGVLEMRAFLLGITLSQK